MSMTLGYWDIRGLPYLIDGTHKITQSNAILRYIARKHNLCGETEEEKIRVDILENQAMDVSNQLARVCYSPDFEKLKPEYLEGLPTMMQHFSQFLGKRPWFVGDKITFVDFLAYDVLDLHRIFEPKCLDAFPNLKDFISHFECSPCEMRSTLILLLFTDLLLCMRQGVRHSGRCIDDRPILEKSAARGLQCRQSSL
ncbi:glutathione S-transferase Mu 4 isoform X2 [Macaca mulatta]|uniref:glutathione S-transferase Mu 4 isoform X4 n=1 Tax=Macaca mulatta TaxID=9544 RepID=UPI0010A2A61D|nr:glutathione S-transferase Mu 4 isoform X4 [Macaca mulatta]